MHDHSMQFSTTKGLAVIVGAIGIGLLVANLFTTARNDHVGLLGVPFICASSVLWVRSFLCRMEERERAAFEVGRQVGGGAEVRSLR